MQWSILAILLHRYRIFSQQGGRQLLDGIVISCRPFSKYELQRLDISIKAGIVEQRQARVEIQGLIGLEQSLAAGKHNRKESTLLHLLKDIDYLLGLLVLVIRRLAPIAL